jgi:glycosyltransferase involved in cell wall biosynthesis
MRILFANHTSAWSGAEVTLMRVVETLRQEHDVVVACPAVGPLADAVERAGIDRLSLPAVNASLRLHPVQTPMGVAQLGAGGLALARAARRFRAEVIHANTPRAGVMGAIARRLGGPPFVVRAHEHLPLTPAGRTVRALIAHTAGVVAAVSDYTARRFNEGLEHPIAVRVYNGIDHARFDPARVEPAMLREELGLARGAALIGQVAQITPWKGQDTAIRALAELRRAGLDAHLMIVGEVAFAGKGVRYDNRGFRRALERLVDELAVQDAVHFLGRREDVPEVLRALDLSVLPSWEEPFGLVTVESMALRTPPLVSTVGAGPELVQDGVSGRLLPPRRPELWAAAARDLLEDRRTLLRMGEQGPAAAAPFRDEVQARNLLALYERVVAPRSRAAAVAAPAAAAEPSDDLTGTPWPS